MTLTIEAPIKTVNPLNIRELWQQRSARVKKERRFTAIALMGKKLPPLPWVVTMTRLSPGTLDDDAVPGAFKGIRDEIAAWIQLKDNDPRITWRYAQAKGKLGVRIEIGERDENCT